MKFINKISLSILLAVIFFSSFPSAVLAQEEPVIYQQDSLSQDIRQLTIQYRGELEEYRNLENLYLIAKDQYLKLETLASLEDAVQKTQEAMDARAKVLRTYLRLLRLKLLSQAGIELPDKKAAEQTLLAAIQKIEQHQQQLKEPLDKPQLNEISIEFELLIDEVEDSAYQTLSLMAIGELQNIHDRSGVLRDDMEVEIATAGGALKSAERQRSFAETDRLLKTLKPEFDEVEKKYSRPTTSGYKGIYNAIENRLESIHSTLSKAVGFLEELLKV